MMQRHHLLLVACTVSGAWLSGCGDGGPPRGSADVARPLPSWIVREAPTEITRSFPGVVTASDFVVLSFEVSGRVTELPVLEAQELRKGDLIARVDERDFRNRVDAARALVAATEGKLSRLNIAYEKNAVTEMEVIELRAARDSAVADLNIALKALEDTEIRAPYNGIVANKMVDTFTDVEPGDGVVMFGAIQDIKIVISLPEQDVVHANERDPGRFTATFGALPGRRFPLVYREATAQADLITQTYEVTFTMRAPEDVNVLPGMTAEVSWTRDLRAGDPAVLIPASAAFSTPEGGSAVWVVDPANGAVSRRTVRTGAFRSENLIAVLDGLRAGELIAAAGINHLRDGVTVRPSLLAGDPTSESVSGETAR